MEKPEVLFYRWYVHPLKMLQCIPNGDGGFIALATSCILYERYAIATIKNSPVGGKATKETKISQFMHDFGVDQETATAFWNVVRNGLLHQAMPKQYEYGEDSLPRWWFRHDFPKSVELIEHGGKRILKIQPWLVMDRVISLWQQNLDLLKQSDSFPWANISPLPI